MATNPEVLNHLRRTLTDGLLRDNGDTMRALQGQLRLAGDLAEDDPRKVELRAMIRVQFDALATALSEIP